MEAVKNNEQGLAMELLNDQRKQNKRLFIMWLITFLTLIGVTCYTIYLVSDIGVIEDKSIDIQDVENIDNSHIKIGNDLWEKSK